jgi:hypothetical protein
MSAVVMTVGRKHKHHAYFFEQQAIRGLGQAAASS